MAREDKIIIRVTEELKNEFQTLAESMGMTMSGLGAFVIGNYLKEEKHRREMQQKMLEQLSPHFLETITNSVNVDDPRVTKAIAETVAHLAAAQNRP